MSVAIDIEHVQFFNETTTRVITMEDCAYEEVENTKSLEEDNVVIIDQKKKKKDKKASQNLKEKEEKPASLEN